MCFYVDTTNYPNILSDSKSETISLGIYLYGIAIISSKQKYNLSMMDLYAEPKRCFVEQFIFRPTIISSIFSFLATTTTTVIPCPTGYTGASCTIPLCNGAVNGCNNGGTCTSTLKIDILFTVYEYLRFLLLMLTAPSVCTCASGWTRPSCSNST
jgi:hypothetical protein